MLFVNSGYAQAEFELRNQEGLSLNPAGVRLVLRTEDARSTFHLYQTIPIEVEFSSSTPSAYSIELDEIMNFAGSANRLEVSPIDTVFLTASPTATAGAVCCASNKRYLTRQPLALKRELTDYLRFEKPGTYSIFFVTNRVFRNLGKHNDFEPSKLTLTSSILTLTILPDDPDWDSQQLAVTLQKLHDPRVKANYLAGVRRARQYQQETEQNFAMANLIPQSQFVLAQKSLNALDTSEAIQERVAMMQMESKSDLKMARDYLTGSILDQPLLASTTRPDLLEAALRSRAAEPNFGVDYDYVLWWIKFMIQRDHPELFRPSSSETERKNKAAEYAAWSDRTELDLLAKLELLVQAKNGDPHEVTALTIKLLKHFKTDPH
jgi:hypothetical protein